LPAECGAAAIVIQAGDDGVHMWHDMYLAQITLAEKVIRTITLITCR
jgi:hypothetical protein